MNNYFLINPKEERLSQLREEALNQMKQEFFLMEFDEIKRAIKYFKIIRKRRIGGTSDYYDLAINALERQIPQEGVGEEGCLNCPKCGTGLMGKYCYECGQKY